jgi:protein-arginine kinase activator protein McsA
MDEENKNEIKDLGICVRCKKNKATLTYTDNVLSFVHGFKERICQECYDNQMRESNWYKQGLKVAIEIIDNKLKNAKRFTGNKSILKELKKEFEEKLNERK